MADDIIRASEIAQYAYCARAWWLGRVKGYRSTNLAAMQQGEQHHRTHGQAVKRVDLIRRVAFGLFALALVLLVIWLIASLGR